MVVIFLDPAIPYFIRREAAAWSGGFFEKVDIVPTRKRIRRCKAGQSSADDTDLHGIADTTGTAVSCLIILPIVLAKQMIKKAPSMPIDKIAAFGCLE